MFNLLEIARPFSKITVSFYLSNTCGFQVLHILANSWYSLFKKIFILFIYFSFIIAIFFFFFLVVSGLSCGIQDLSLRRMGSVVVVRGLSCPAACGILIPWPGIRPVHPMHCKADSLPLDHQGSPWYSIFYYSCSSRNETVSHCDLYLHFPND